MFLIVLIFSAKILNLQYNCIAFMEKITEQPSHYNNIELKTTHEILSEINREDHLVADAVERTIPQIERLVDLVAERMKKNGKVFYIGAGTSGRIGVLDASELPPTFGVSPTLVKGIIAGGDTALRNAVENAEDSTEQGWNDLQEHGIKAEDTVIGIAASGTTPYVVGAIEKARKESILTAGITSNPDSPLSRAAEIAIEVVVGPEYITGSSRMKSGTAQKMILNMISTALMIHLGRIKDNKMVNMQLNNQKLIDRGTRIIAEELGIGYCKAQQLLLLNGSVKAVLSDKKKDSH